MTDSEIVGQALYTWGWDPIGTGRAGYGFADISPAWKDQFAWLEAATKSLTSFVGRYQPTAEERASYRPLGRHVHAGVALAYRKYDLGSDGYNRSGNYAAHFFIAPMQQMGITDILKIRDELFIKVNSVYDASWAKLDDIGLNEFRGMLYAGFETRSVNSKRVISALGELVRTGSINVSEWGTAEIASLVGTLPCWADHVMHLVPEWTSNGPSQNLYMPEDADTGMAFENRRLVLASEQLIELKEKLDTATCFAEVKSIISPRASSFVPDTVKSQKHLEDCIIKWVNKNITAEELTLLGENPTSTFMNLDRLHRHIPSGRKVDMFTLTLLNRCDSTIDRKLLGRVLPAEDELTALYAGASDNVAVLEAAILRNAEPGRFVDIVLRRTLPEATVRLLIDKSKTDDVFMAGLVNSLKISSLGGGTFARQLFLASSADWDYLYSILLPAAADGRADSLLSLACVNPDEFISWIGVPEPYAGALTEMLRHETQQAMWERISGFLGRWRKR